MTTDNRRQITAAGGMIEVVLPKLRQIGDVAASAEIAFGHYRQISEVAVLVELVPCIERPGDYGYEEKQFYLEKLRYLNEHHGRQADLTPYEGCISVARLEALKQLYIDELLATDVMAPIASLLQPLSGLDVFRLWDVFIRLQEGCGANPGLACVVEQGIAELDPLLREHFTNQIRTRVGHTFGADGITTLRLYEIFVKLQSCAEGDYLCMVDRKIPEIEDALARTLIAAIRAIIDAPEAEGPKFDERGITTRRLAQIHRAIRRSTPEMIARWKTLPRFPEIEEVIRARWLERTFRVFKSRMQAGRKLGRSVDDYRRAVEAAFSVTFATQDDQSYPWGPVAIHFVRLALDAVARAFESWVERQHPARWVNRFRLFRSVMGRMTFKNMNTLAMNFAKSAGHTIEIFQRPVTIEYYVYKVNGVWTHVPKSSGKPAGYEEGDGYVARLPQYSSGVYGVGDMVPAGRQAVMTPNNLVHELGHSLNRYAGFGDAGVGSLEHAIMAAGMPLDRAGMGGPLDAELYYQHAVIAQNPDTYLAELTPLHDALNIPFEKSDFLCYDLFEDKFWLWNGEYNPFAPFNLAARVDVFIHNPLETASETAADAFLNWVRDSFDDYGGGQNGSAGQKWKDFFAANIGAVLRNAVLWQKLYYGEDLNAIIAYYQSRGFIGEPFFGTVPDGEGYALRKTPDVAGVKLGNAATSGLLDRAKVPIYGRFEPPGGIPGDSSRYWLLVSTLTGELAWIASNGLVYEDETLMSKPEIDIDNLSPARSFDIEDLDIILG